MICTYIFIKFIKNTHHHDIHINEHHVPVFLDEVQLMNPPGIHLNIIRVRHLNLETNILISIFNKMQANIE